MFRHLFAVMNEVLDDIIREYPAASPARRRHLDEQLEMLKGLGDMVMEEWLVFEEKWSRAKQQTSEANGGLPSRWRELPAISPESGMLTAKAL